MFPKCGFRYFSLKNLTLCYFYFLRFGVSTFSFFLPHIIIVIIVVIVLIIIIIIIIIIVVVVIGVLLYFIFL